MLAIIRKIWPPNKAVRLRASLSKVYRSLVYSRFISWVLWNKLFHGKTRWISIYNNSAKIVIRTNDYRGYIISRMGGTQYEKIRIWRTLAALNPEVCIDVGANYGEFTAAVATTTGQDIYVIEANALLTDCLEQSFAGKENIHIINRAASDEDGEMDFFYNAASSGSASVSINVPKYEKRTCIRGGAIQSAKMQTIRIDKYLEQKNKGFPASFIIKIDVEGHDEAAFQGIQNLISNAQWWRALIEFSPQAICQAGGSPDGFWERISEYQGTIIYSSECADDAIDIDLSGTKLPKKAPDDECEVLIGSGKLKIQDRENAT